MKEGKVHAGCLAVVCGVWSRVLLRDTASLGVAGWSCSVLSPSERAVVSTPA